MPRTLEERFWAKVDKNGPTMPHMTTCCWLWTASKIRNGYGRIYTENRTWDLAHRVSFKLKNQREPSAHVLHHCDNRICVRPDHLFEGSNQDNVADRENKGRGNQPKGTRVANSHLSEDAVRTIREEYSSGAVSQTALAEKYNTTHVNIGLIVRRKTWRHI